MRVALGSVARQFLAELGISVGSHVVAIGSVRSTDPDSEVFEFGWNGRADSSLVRCLCPEATEKMVAEIERARVLGDTLGGVFEVRVTGLPLGLGSYSQWNRRIDGQLGQAFMSLNAIKGVEIGLGFQAAASFGSQVHDVYYDVYHDLSRDLHHDFSKGANDAARVSGTARVRYGSNRSGGLDGGMTSGEPLVIRAAMKPLATLMKPLQSVDLATGKAALAHIERSDVCAVPSAAVIGESLAALVLAQAVLEKFGGDQLAEVKARVLAWAEV